MKKIKLKQQLLCVSLLFTCLLQAQLDKKTWLVGGNASFSTYKSETTSSTGQFNDTEYTYFKIEPNIGYFLIDKFAMGITSSIYANFEKKNTILMYSFGPFARYYWLKPENRINLLTHIQFVIGGNNKNGSKSNEFNFKIGPVIYFNSNVGLEMTLGYTNSNFNHGIDKTKSSALGLNIGLQIHLDK